MRRGGRDRVDGTYYTVRVEAFGYAEVFSKVTRITGDFGSGNDSMIVLPSAGTIAPAGFPMTISGGGGDDLLKGGPADDTIRGGPGGDVVRCGSGDDTVFTRGNDRVRGDCEVVNRR